MKQQKQEFEPKMYSSPFLIPSALQNFNGTISPSKLRKLQGSKMSLVGNSLQADLSFILYAVLLATPSSPTNPFSKQNYEEISKFICGNQIEVGEFYQTTNVQTEATCLLQVGGLIFSEIVLIVTAGITSSIQVVKILIWVFISFFSYLNIICLLLLLCLNHNGEKGCPVFINSGIRNQISNQQMQTSRISGLYRIQEHGQPIRPIEMPCRQHSGSICLNYCHEFSCFRFLCEQCIEEHLDHHKKNSLPVLSIRSLKKVRESCVEKLNRLIEELGVRMGSLEQPKSPDQILEEANIKFNAIKKVMFDIIEQELDKFYKQLSAKVNQSFSTIKALEEIHNNLSKIILQLQESKSIIVEGAHELPDTLQKVITMDEKLYIDTFTREAADYTQKLAHVDFNISINEVLFRNSVNQALRINRVEDQPPSMTVSRNTSAFNGRNSQINRSRSRSAVGEQLNLKKVQIDPRLESQIKILHFFETDASRLHLIDLSSPNGKIRKQIVPLKDFTVPTFHASILTFFEYIFISGGIMEIGDREIKSNYLSKYSLKSKGTDQFKKDFSKVKQRSSHCLCQFGDSLYILGGYGPGQSDDPQVQKSVEKVSIKSGNIEHEPPSRFGGACIATVIHNKILKASEEGIQIYAPALRTWSLLALSDQYKFVQGCGWSKVSESVILIYGGYDDQERGISTCSSWEISESQAIVRNHPFRLPQKQGFLNNPGIIFGGQLFVLQNILAEEEGEEEVGDILEHERALLKFDGQSWHSLSQ